MSFEAQRNVDCDGAAGRKVETVEEEEFESEVVEAVGAMLWSQGGGITGDPYEWVERDRAEGVVRKRLRMTKRVFDLVD